jgi:hypothetical protein
MSLTVRLETNADRPSVPLTGWKGIEMSVTS